MNPSIVPTVPEVPVNGAVLKWARELRGLSIQDAANLLGIEPVELRAYEANAQKPLVGFLRLMAQRYRVNFTSLLMPEPLPPETRPVDHRARSARLPLSMDTLIAIEEISEALDAFVEIAEDSPRIVPVPVLGQAQLTDDPEKIAERERKKFQISVKEQATWVNLGTARRQWRQRIEDLGIFTYMIPMPPRELSGFSMIRGALAAICVNDREPTEGAKIFTFFHEYCHLLLRQTGISDENNSNDVERFCNRFAGSFLMPRKALREAIGDVALPHEFSDTQVRKLSTQFRVSNRAVAMRLQETGFAPDGFYARRTGPWDLPAEPRPQRADSAPNYVTIRIKRIGRLHTKTVLRAAKRKVINSFDATDLTGLQPAALSKLQQTLG